MKTVQVHLVIWTTLVSTAKLGPAGQLETPNEKDKQETDEMSVNMLYCEERL